MKSLLIDTNVYSAFKAGIPEAVHALSRPERIVVCSTVLGELLCGFRCGSKQRQNRSELEVFLGTPRVAVVGTDDSTAEFYSQIYKALRDRGTPIPTNDMWIAASALQHGAAVCSFDAHFAGIAGLLAFTPAEL